MAKSVAKKNPAGKKKAAPPRKTGRKGPVKRSAAPASLEDHDRLISAVDARMLLGFPETEQGRRQLRNQVEHGRLKPVPIGKRNFYRLSHIEDIIENGAPSPGRHR